MGSSSKFIVVPQAHSPAGSHTQQCQWDQRRRWQWCPCAHSGLGASALPVLQCSSQGPREMCQSAAWHSSFFSQPLGTHICPEPSLLVSISIQNEPLFKYNSSFSEILERLNIARVAETGGYHTASQGLEENHLCWTATPSLLVSPKLCPCLPTPFSSSPAAAHLTQPAV